MDFCQVVFLALLSVILEAPIKHQTPPPL